jgi:hypothetical protein
VIFSSDSAQTGLPHHLEYGARKSFLSCRNEKQSGEFTLLLLPAARFFAVIDLSSVAVFDATERLMHPPHA